MMIDEIICKLKENEGNIYGVPDGQHVEECIKKYYKCLFWDGTVPFSADDECKLQTGRLTRWTRDKPNFSKMMAINSLGNGLISYQSHFAYMIKRFKS